ncbi:PEFG-CTERM domain-containing protein [Nitrosopumilus cobalaminigenes]|uniref:PEFG-CTERM domain-containing protein n=1 Tax=Nitrosopumilus cobalaminigenes TaxID=1470066 RepID=A0A7D5M1P1_9ARCH|nr:PEFG-CTERM sorting domain-containing protein [Nitrosopumilus cobalaminigenes]QLH02388.1 PEFG-CTERM domain-containing protein [Nitrosopumilus cobalaminigenes]
MNFKRSTTSMAIALMVLSIVSMTSIQQDAFAQTLGMSITATADKGSDTITVSGKTISKLNDVTFTVTSPSGSNVVAIDQVSPDAEGIFVKTFKVGPTWTEDGFYKIKAMQGTGANSLYTLKVFVEVTDGMTKRTSVTESNLETGIFSPNTTNVAKDTGLMLDAIIIENGSTMFEVTGKTDRVSQDITVKVIAPNGNVVKVAQISPMLDGEFAAKITVGGPLWKQDGFYTVSVKQFDDPKYTASSEVDIKDGVVVPEFGTIAAMILAVAIISIIAVSAKSRLSIIPRY